MPRPDCKIVERFANFGSDAAFDAWVESNRARVRVLYREDRLDDDGEPWIFVHYVDLDRSRF